MIKIRLSEIYYILFDHYRQASKKSGVFNHQIICSPMPLLFLMGISPHSEFTERFNGMGLPRVVRLN
jgi:hypothetical protein